jgi:phytanoyl-CoA hydroxylase
MDNDGYVVVQEVFSETVIEQTTRKIEEFLASRVKATGKKQTIQFVQKIAEQVPEVYELAKTPQLVEVATLLLGKDIDLYFNQAVYKNPGEQKAFSWHQDDAYGPVEPSPYLTVWIALSDATEENGCLSVLPGSHIGGLRPHKNSDFGLSGYSLDDPNQGVLVPLQAGSVVFMWSTTLHKSGPNLSCDTRKGLVFQYAPVGLKHKASGMAIVSKMPIARQY